MEVKISASIVLLLIFIALSNLVLKGCASALNKLQNSSFSQI